MFDQPLHLLNVYKETISDGDGFRYSIYLSGCSHHCKGCHNPQSWNPKAGILLTKEMVNEMINEINANPLLDGITFSGGDPFFYSKSFCKLLKIMKERTKKNIWCYTGYTLLELKAEPELDACLEYIDVLVEGRFVEELHHPDLRFVGSGNQKIIRLNRKNDQTP